MIPRNRRGAAAVLMLGAACALVAGTRIALTRGSDARISRADGLVATMETGSNLPDSARAALAEADRADGTIRDLYLQGMYRAAIPLARAQLTTRCRVLGECARDVAVSWNSLGDLLMVQGDVFAARDCYVRALAIRRKVLGEKHPDVAQSLEALGLVEKNLGELEQARAHLQQALEMRRALFGEKHPSLAFSLNRLGELLRREDRGDEATAAFAKALRLLEKSSLRRSPETVDVLCNLGLGQYYAREYESAERNLRRALDLAHQVPGVSIETIAYGTSVYGATLWKERKYEAAEPVQREASKIYEFLRRQAVPGTRPYHGLGIYSQIALTQLERGRFDVAWPTLERGLNRALLDALVPAGDSAAPASPRELVEDRRFCGLERLQSTIPENTALIGWLTSYTKGIRLWDYPIWAYVIRRSGPVHWIRISSPPGSAGKTASSSWVDLQEALVRESEWPVRRQAALDLEEKQKAAYRELLEPLQPYLTGATHLVIVKAFFTEACNVETLLDPVGSFVGERYRISYTPSGTLYAWMRGRARPPKEPRAWQVLAVGDPMSGAEPARGAPLASLPKTREEILGIASIFPHCTVLVGRDASKQYLTSLATSRRIGGFDLIHFALHAGKGSKAPITTALLLGAPGVGGPMNGAAVSSDVEISNWEIRSSWRLEADLVTLSACRSYGGCGSTEANDALGEAFLAAGARSVVATTWSVDDEATALLMERFYENLSGAYRDERLDNVGRRMSKVEALFEARNWLRTYRDPQGQQPFANPIYWGAFTLVGDAGE